MCSDIRSIIIVKVQSVLDKGDSYLQFRELFKRDAIIISKKADYKRFCEFVKAHPIFVKKSVFFCMGKGTVLVDLGAGNTDKRAFFNHMITTGKYLLEEKITQCDEMARFNTSSVNTIRCMTMKTKQGVETPWCFMRSGRKGSFVDNGGVGGILVGVDPKTGIACTYGYDEYNEKYERHPDSGAVFMGTQIPEWDSLLALCKNAAADVEGMGYLSWDLAYTDKGWIVVEVNEVGQFIGPQMTMKKGIKKELWSYLDRMEKFC